MRLKNLDRKESSDGLWVCLLNELKPSASSRVTFPYYRGMLAKSHIYHISESGICQEEAGGLVRVAFVSYSCFANKYTK